MKGYPKMPPLTTTKQPVQSLSEDQYPRISKLVKTGNLKGQQDTKSNKFRYEQLQTDSTKDLFYYESDSKSSGINEGSIFNSESLMTPPGYLPSSSPTHQGQGRASSLSIQTPISGRLVRYMSEPTLHTPPDHKSMLEMRKNRFSQAATKRSSMTAISLLSPAGGQIEFGLYYNLEQKSLDITIKQLCDLTLKPEHFIGVLDVLQKHEKRQMNTKVYLTQNQDGSLELSDSSNIAFLIYLTLLPKKTFIQHTKTVFGTGKIEFNETFSVIGYSTEQLSTFFLCFHVLCKFGRDGEPIVLGEVKMPLKRIEVSQALPFMANLGPPEEELELEVSKYYTAVKKN